MAARKARCRCLLGLVGADRAGRGGRSDSLDRPAFASPREAGAAGNRETFLTRVAEDLRAPNPGAPGPRRAEELLDRGDWDGVAGADRADPPEPVATSLPPVGLEESGGGVARMSARDVVVRGNNPDHLVRHGRGREPALQLLDVGLRSYAGS